MSKLEAVIGDLEHVLERLNGIRDGLKQIKDESEAVEKARDTLRGRRTAEKGRAAGIGSPSPAIRPEIAICPCNFREIPFINSPESRGQRKGIP